MLLHTVPEDGRGDSWWIVLRDGTPVRGDRSGVLLLLVALWLARPVGRIPRSLRVSSFLGTLDDALAAHRRERLARRVDRDGLGRRPGLPSAHGRESIVSDAG